MHGRTDIAGHRAAVLDLARLELLENSQPINSAGNIPAIRNMGREFLKMVHVYLPRAYDDDGEELLRGKP
jgi:hypothetical protein